MRVVCDPGHAGRTVDPGAINQNSGLQEADIALVVSRLVKQYLEAAGCEVKLTRDAWEDPKTDELSYRTSVANEWGTDVFVSLHCNSAISEEAKGFEVWTSPGQTDGDNLAGYIYSQIRNTFPDRQGRGLREANFYVLTHTNAPACLVEMAFISNDEEAQLLSTPSWQEQMARAIARGVTDYASRV
ncbi:MAG: cell wall hydrolase/autolysin [Firmicutes bacterium]|nr:cell wall hydrolase/autolysin [Bacillota bacterium]